MIDICREEGSSPYKLSEGSKFSGLSLVKRALSLFLHNKHTLNPNHKYALVVLQDIPIWVSKKLLSNSSFVKSF